MTSLRSLRQSWLRTALAVLVLCFALGTVAQAGHHHALGAEHTQKNACDFCTSFGSLADAPTPVTAACATQAVFHLTVAPATGFIATQPVSVAQARAPPC